jgi:hypothetical protein
MSNQFSNAVDRLIRLEAMKAENVRREDQGLAQAYGEEAFLNLLPEKTNDRELVDQLKRALGKQIHLQKITKIRELENIVIHADKGLGQYRAGEYSVSAMCSAYTVAYNQLFAASKELLKLLKQS